MATPVPSLRGPGRLERRGRLEVTVSRAPEDRARGLRHLREASVREATAANLLRRRCFPGRVLRE